MELPPELTRIPFASLDVLRYMGQSGISSGDADSLAAGTGMSERGMGKAIRGLVTKGYLDMDNNYVYYLTEKGSKAIQDIAAYDASRPQGVKSADAGGAQQELIAITPDAIFAQQPATLQVGLNGLEDVTEESHLMLRFSALGGDVAPAQITLDLQPGQVPQPINAQVTASGDFNAVRVRLEVVQIIGEADVFQAGGMFFDIPLGQSGGHLQAWYGSLSLQGN